MGSRSRGSKEAIAISNGVLCRPYSPFYGKPLPIGTPCEIINEAEETYTVKFPGKVGYSGSFGIKKVYVLILE